MLTDHCFFVTKDERNDDGSTTVECGGGFSGLKSKKLKKLAVIRATELSFYEFCVESKLFTELEYLEAHLLDIETLLYINDKIKSLKKIKVTIGGEYKYFVMLMLRDKNQLKKLRKNLKVNIWGLDYNRKDESSFFSFLYLFADTQFNSPILKMHLQINEKSVNFLKTEVATPDFYAQFNEITFEKLILDKAILSKMINVKYFVFYVQKQDQNFKAFLDLFPHLVELHMWARFQRSTHCENNLLDLIPQCKCLKTLVILNWKDINFDFLFKIKYLKNLVLMVKHPMEPSQFISLIESKIGFLKTVDISFEKPVDLGKEQLKACKDQLLDRLNGDLKTRESDFAKELKIQIHSTGKRSFVRCRYTKLITKLASFLNAPVLEEKVILRTMNSMIEYNP